MPWSCRLVHSLNVLRESGPFKGIELNGVLHKLTGVNGLGPEGCLQFLLRNTEDYSSVCSYLLLTVGFTCVTGYARLMFTKYDDILQLRNVGQKYPRMTETLPPLLPLWD